MSRFGGADRGDEGSGAGGEAGEVEDSIDQGPWGLAAYAYYWWSGATGQVRIFRRYVSTFSLRPIGSQDPGRPSWMFGTATD